MRGYKLIERCHLQVDTDNDVCIDKVGSDAVPAYQEKG